MCTAVCAVCSALQACAWLSAAYPQNIRAGAACPLQKRVKAARQHTIDRHALHKVVTPALGRYLSSGSPCTAHPCTSTAGVLSNQGHSNAPGLGRSHTAACSCRKAACALHPKGHSWLPSRDHLMLHARHMRATCCTPGPRLCMPRSTCLLLGFACYSLGHACYMIHAGLHADYMRATCCSSAPALSESCP